MKKIIRRSATATVTLTVLLLILVCSPVQNFAQQNPDLPPPADGNQEAPPPPNQDGDLVRQLNLTPEQMERIRTIREENRETRRETGMRVRQARQALDRAIYLENADEAVVEVRVRELVEAQAAVMRLQALTELRIRRVLSPEQLTTLRTLRMEQARTAERNRRLRDERGRRERQRGVQPPVRDSFNQNLNAPRQGDSGTANAPDTRPRRGDLLRGTRRP
jgi:Spy/CpxP family protein refolding chaperone